VKFNLNLTINFPNIFIRDVKRYQGLVNQTETEKCILNSRYLAKLSVLAALLFQPWHVEAGTWQHSISAGVSTEYESNPAMIPIYQGSVRRTLFEPSYTLIGHNGASELKAGFALQIARSSNHILSPNRQSPSVFLDWLKRSEWDEFGILSRYDEIMTRYAGIDAVNPVPVTSTRASRTISGRLSKAVSKRNTVSANVSYEGVTYKGGGGFVDYVTQSGDLRLNHDLSETSSAYWMLSGEKYIPEFGASHSLLANVTAGLNWKLSENLNGALHIGSTKSNDTRAILVGGASAQYSGERSQFAFNLNRQVIPSGLGGYVITNQLTGGWGYSLSERSNMGIDMTLLRNLSTTIYNLRVNTGVWMQRNLSPSWVGRINYLRINLTGGGVQNISSNIIGISLAFSNSNF